MCTSRIALNEFDVNLALTFPKKTCLSWKGCFGYQGTGCSSMWWKAKEDLGLVRFQTYQLVFVIMLRCFSFRDAAIHLLARGE